MESNQIIQGRQVGRKDLEYIRQLLADRPHWSRRRLSGELAQAWNWRNGAGQLKDMAARTLLLKLEQRGLIALPPRRFPSPRRRPLSPELPLEHHPCIAEKIQNLMPVCIKLISANGSLFSRYLAQYHYLGYGGPVGENLAYLVRDRDKRDLACILFGAAAWKTQPRDDYIGWADPIRTQNLPLVVNNTRFLILPWVRVPHLASHLLGRILRRLNADWQAKYGHPVYLVETFVEQDRFQGTCYRAANWICVGQTQGRSRQDRFSKMRVPIKDIFLYPLDLHFRKRLCRVDT